jgi:5-(carboxyamino)imidazole ribonucleotide mutase
MTDASPSGATPAVAVIMGSDSDHRVMGAAVEVLGELGVDCEVRVVSAHRTPHDMVAFATGARDRGIRVIIAGAGGAAHLPGMVASMTTLPVIGVPVNATALDGLDSLLSIVQMPKGVPVATMAIDGARNAGLFAARILAVTDDDLAGRLAGFADAAAEAARAGNERLG